jgi:hypothetical protein
LLTASPMASSSSWSNEAASPIGWGKTVAPPMSAGTKFGMSFPRTTTPCKHSLPYP